MDVVTAKPSAELRARIPHHLLDLCEPCESFSVAQYLTAACEVANDVIARGHAPLFVGGTGLYLRTLLRGVFDGPMIPPQVREQLEIELSSSSAAELHARLAAVDAKSARRIHANDSRRILRALEVYCATGRPLSELQQQSALPLEDRPQNVFWLAAPRRWLYERIDSRVERMFADGLVDEVLRLLAGPHPLSHTARQALGYQEVIAHLERGVPMSETVALIQRRTRQFAKRQYTWFRNLEECRPIETTGAETPDQLAEAIFSAAAVQ
jgi:tRNA dimethylallyltransferase